MIGVTFRSVNEHFPATNLIFLIIPVCLLLRRDEKKLCSALRNIVYPTGLILILRGKNMIIFQFYVKEH